MYGKKATGVLAEEFLFLRARSASSCPADRDARLRFFPIGAHDARARVRRHGSVAPPGVWSKGSHCSGPRGDESVRLCSESHNMQIGQRRCRR